MPFVTGCWRESLSVLEVKVKVKVKVKVRGKGPHITGHEGPEVE
jgi:hypothetical protein